MKLIDRIGDIMLKIEEFIRKYTTLYSSHLINPRFIKTEDMVFPENSTLMWYKCTSVLDSVTENSALIKNTKHPLVYSPQEYSSEIEEQGRYTYLSSNHNKGLKLLKKNGRRFKVIPNKRTRIAIPKDKLYLVNYGILNYNYRYQSHPFTSYHIWHNSFSSMCSNAKLLLNGDQRNIFINLEIPNVIPTKLNVEQALKNMTRKLLDEVFVNYKYFNLLEVIRFCNAEHKEESILNKYIPMDKLHRVNLIFTLPNGVSIVNLAKLHGMLKDNKTRSTLGVYDSKSLLKVLLVHFNTLTNEISTPITLIDKHIEELEHDSVIDTKEHSKEELDNIDGLLNTFESEDALEETKDLEADILDNDKVDTVIGQKDNDDLATEDKIKDVLEVLKKDKLLTKAKKDSLEKLLDKQKTTVIKHLNTTLTKVQDYSNVDVEIDDKTKELPDTPSVLDKTMNNDVIKTSNAKYIKNVYKKDIANAILGVQRGNFIVSDYEVEETETILGGLENHKFTLHNVLGGKATRNFYLPKLKEDGTFLLSGNNYLLRKQKADLIIRKISASEVNLSTSYGKCNITKAMFKNNDIGYAFLNMLVNKSMFSKNIKDLVTVGVDNVGQELPNMYHAVSRYVKSFTVNDIKLSFDYLNTKTANKNIDYTKQIKDGYTPVGHKGTKPVVMNKEGNIFIYDKGYEDLGSIFKLIGVDESKLPIEFATAKIYGKKIPLGLILSYYYGLDGLLKLLKSEYRYSENPKHSEDEYRIIFKDTNLFIKRDNAKGDIILAGLTSLEKTLKTVNHNVMFKRSLVKGVFRSLNYPLLYVNELELMEDLFVSPIAAENLKLLKEPTTFKKLLIRAAELLEDNNYKNPNVREGSYYKGYDRIADFVYKELVNSIRADRNRSYFSKSTLKLNPYAVLTKINEDNTKVQIDDLNPMAFLKQTEDMTYLGDGGRTEVTMTRRTRGMDPTDIGVISESTKDSGSVGITAHLSASPALGNLRGITKETKANESGWSSLVSTSAMLSPFGLRDDPKRLMFSSVMNSHIIPIKGMSEPWIRTGYESVAPLRMSDKFVTPAEAPGEVTKVDKNKVTIKYKLKDGKTTNATYTIKNWTSKEESGTCYEHVMTTFLKKGDKLKKGDTIIYDKAFFCRDLFNPSRVIYRMGMYVNTAMVDEPQTYEDSGSISQDLVDTMSTKVTHVRDVIIDAKDNILEVLEAGTKVNYSDDLYIILPGMSGDVTSIDKTTKEILTGLKSGNNKAEYNGVLKKITIRYNCETTEMSTSLKKLTKKLDEISLDEDKHTGRVNGSYSVKGKVLPEGKVHIKFYIEEKDSMGMQDKAIAGNQLKFTVGEVFNYKITTEDGTPIGLKFASRSEKARIVNSPILMGSTAMLLDWIKQEAKKL